MPRKNGNRLNRTQPKRKVASTEESVVSQSVKPRGYRLGQRNPETMPGRYLNSESPAANEAATRNLRRLRRWTHPVAGCGAKYI